MATPHNGKPKDFQLFLALLDADRFEGRFRDGVHFADASDLMRRRERLERRLREVQILKRGADIQDDVFAQLPSLTEDDIEELEDDAPDAEVEQAEEAVVDQATAAQTIAAFEAEITILKNLESLALKVRRSGTDKKWEELSSILQNHAEMFDAHGHRRKMVIFSEHRDTLNYLAERLHALLGAPEALVTVHGAMGREERTKAQETFKVEPQPPEAALRPHPPHRSNGSLPSLESAGGRDSRR